ncbi:MAG: tetratricopeptide repeat protein [Nitrospirota bacterium]
MVKFVAIVFVLCVGALALLAMSNTDSVLVTIPFYNTYELSKIALILISSGSGALLVLFLFIVRDTRRMVSTYQFQKKQRKEEKINGLYSRAMNAMLADNLAEARAYLQDILKVESEHAQALMRLGDLASRDERHDEALRQYKKALTASQDDLESIEALFAIATLLERLERWPDALEYVENILEKDPENLGAMYLKRSVMERMGRWGALIELQKAILKAEQKAGRDTRKEETVLNGYLPYPPGRRGGPPDKHKRTLQADKALPGRPRILPPEQHAEVHARKALLSARDGGRRAGDPLFGRARGISPVAPAPGRAVPEEKPVRARHRGVQEDRRFQENAETPVLLLQVWPRGRRLVGQVPFLREMEHLRVQPPWRLQDLTRTA